jgi:hypothetical protein
MYQYVDIFSAAWNVNICKCSKFQHYVECRCIEHAAWSMILPLYVHFVCHGDCECTADLCFLLDIFETLCEKVYLLGFMVSYVLLFQGLINCNVLYKICVSHDGECGVLVYISMLFDGLVALFWLILLFH